MGNDALTALERWQRKGYTAEVVLGPSYQPGDEGFVRLKARSGRTLVVNVYDCPQRDADDMPTATTADMITEALRRWDADPTPKKFHALVWVEGVTDLPPGCIHWITGRSVMATVTAANDAGATAAALALFPSDAGATCESVWEV